MSLLSTARSRRVLLLALGGFAVLALVVVGVVVSVGSAVTRFGPGDAVMGETVRGMQWRNGGAWAELVAAPEDGLVRTPAGLTPEQAADPGFDLKRHANTPAATH